MLLYRAGKIISVRSEDMLFVNYSAAIDNPKVCIIRWNHDSKALQITLHG